MIACVLILIIHGVLLKTCNSFQLSLLTCNDENAVSGGNFNVDFPGLSWATYSFSNVQGRNQWSTVLDVALPHANFENFTITTLSGDGLCFKQVYLCQDDIAMTVVPMDEVQWLDSPCAGYDYGAPCNQAYTVHVAAPTSMPTYLGQEEVFACAPPPSFQLSLLTCNDENSGSNGNFNVDFPGLSWATYSFSNVQGRNQWSTVLDVALPHANFENFTITTLSGDGLCFKQVYLCQDDIAMTVVPMDEVQWLDSPCAGYDYGAPCNQAYTVHVAAPTSMPTYLGQEEVFACAPPANDDDDAGYCFHLDSKIDYKGVEYTYEELKAGKEPECTVPHSPASKGVVISTLCDKTVRVTDTHLMATTKGFRLAYSLTAGDILFGDYDGGILCTVTSVEKEKTTQQYFGLNCLHSEVLASGLRASTFGDFHTLPSWYMTYVGGLIGPTAASFLGEYISEWSLFALQPPQP